MGSMIDIDLRTRLAVRSPETVSSSPEPTGWGELFAKNLSQFQTGEELSVVSAGNPPLVQGNPLPADLAPLADDDVLSVDVETETSVDPGSLPLQGASATVPQAKPAPSASMDSYDAPAPGIARATVEGAEASPGNGLEAEAEPMSYDAPDASEPDATGSVDEDATSPEVKLSPEVHQKPATVLAAGMLVPTQSPVATPAPVKTTKATPVTSELSEPAQAGRHASVSRSGLNQQTDAVEFSSTAADTPTPAPNLSASFNGLIDSGTQSDLATAASLLPVTASVVPGAPAVPAGTQPVLTDAMTPALALLTATPAEVVHIISDAAGAPDDRKDQITVQLDPPELGRVSIGFKFDAHGLQHVTITAETPEAMRHMRALHQDLVQSLERNGLSGQSMSFQQEPPRQDQAAMNRRATAAGTETSSTTVPAPVRLETARMSFRSVTSGSGINLKL